MKNGKITQCGKYGDLLNSGADFMELVGAHKKALSTLDSLDGATVSNQNKHLGTYEAQTRTRIRHGHGHGDTVKLKIIGHGTRLCIN